MACFSTGSCLGSGSWGLNVTSMCRRDLDSLRGLAFMLVVLRHLVPRVFSVDLLVAM